MSKGLSEARSFFQSHECQGFRARVTIEWSFPNTVDADLLPVERAIDAEDIADSILAFSGPKMREMVQAMRGYPVLGRAALASRLKED